MTDADSANAFERDKPGTASRTSAELRIEDLRSRGGVFVEAVRATRMAMVLTDPALPGNPIVFANESFLALSGYGMEEVLGQQPYFLNGSDTHPNHAARFREALAQDHDETLQTIQYSKDGRRMVVSLFLTALKDEHGRTLHHLLSWRDITRQVTAEGDADALREAEVRARESEERFRALAAAGSSTFYRMSPDWQKMHELDGPGFIGNLKEPSSDWVENYIPVDERAKVREAITRAIEGKEAFELEHRVLRTDGTVGWTFSRAIPLFDNAGEIVEWFGVASDVTARVKADQSFRRLFEASPAPFLVLAPDSPDFTIRDVNDAYLTATMRKRADVVGRPLFDAFPDNPHEPTINGVSSLRDSLERVLATRQADELPGLKYDIARPDGAFEERWWSPINSPILAENGEVEAIIHNANDVTEERRADAALRTSKQQFETLINQAPLGVYLIDDVLVIQHVNPTAASVFGEIEGGPVGRGLDELIHVLWDQEYADEVIGIFRHTLETGEPFMTPERAEHRRDRDTVEYYEWRLDRIILQDGRYGVVCYFRDVSAQVRARKQIEKANELARQSEERLARDLADTRVLQAASAAMIEDSRGDHAEQAILSAAVAIMRSDAASIQTLDPNTDELVLLGNIGFHPDSARFWNRVTRDGGGTCGQAFNQRTRIIVEDVRELEAVRNSDDLRSYNKSGIVSVQTTPLVTRRGKLIGMMSTHWHRRHCPHESELDRFDVLARQAADLIEWRSTQAALRKSEERLRLIVESAQDYAIFTTDPDDVIDDWMPGAAAVFGFSKEEAEGQPGAIIFTLEDRERGEPEREIVTAAREGQAANVRWHVRKDGQLVFIEGQVVPLRDVAGKVQGFLKIGQDVTERRLAEQALRDSEERFRQFGEASSDLLWIRDAETLAFEYLSPAFDRLYGMPREHVLKANDMKAWAELIHPEDRELGLDMLRQLRSGIPGNAEFRVVRPDGNICWLHDTNFPLRNDSGRVVRIAGIAQDITERKRAVALQATLLAELQHRVRNILAMIQSVVRRTIDTSETPEEYARHLGGRIAAMARTQAMLTRSPTRKIDLEEVLRDELLSVAASEKQHWCEGPQVLLPPKAAEVFTLAIHELATNAVKYGALSAPQGQLEISWHMDNRGEQQWLVFEWEETRVEHSGFSREGFGTELVTRRVPYELRGRGSMKSTEDGMVAKLEFPLVGSNSILETTMPEQLH